MDEKEWNSKVAVMKIAKPVDGTEKRSEKIDLRELVDSHYSWVDGTFGTPEETLDSLYAAE